MSDSAAITITVNEVNVAPVLAAIGNKTVTEMALLAFTATATDADIPANALAFSLDAGAPAGASITAGGVFNWTPTEAQGPGTYPITVRVTDDGTPSMSDFETIQVTVNEVNSAPTADADGPYAGSVNGIINFDGSGSSDPDGDVLTYDWTFGDGNTATGVTPTNSYSAVGTYDVTLRVTDPSGLYDDDATTATIRTEVSADILLENNGSTIDVRKTGNRSTVVGLEETSISYSDLIPSSVRLSQTGPAGFVAECAADTKSFVTGDLDADGVPDLDMRFSNKCLSNLFNNVPDNTVVNVVVTGQFSSGGSTVPLHAERNLTIPSEAPRNPDLPARPRTRSIRKQISYTVQNAGAVTMKIFSVNGRLIRTLKRGEETEAGTHEVMWNGTDDSGRHVSSGIYLVRTSQKTAGSEESMILKVAVAK